MAKRPDEERQLYVPLTEEELLLKGDKQSDCIKRLEDLTRRENALKAQIKSLKDEATEVSAQASSLADDIKNKRERRGVLCRWEQEPNRWELRRADTGKLEDTAPITMADRQQELLS